MNSHCRPPMALRVSVCRGGRDVSLSLAPFLSKRQKCRLGFRGLLHWPQFTGQRTKGGSAYPRLRQIILDAKRGQTPRVYLHTRFRIRTLNAPAPSTVNYRTAAILTSRSVPEAGPGATYVGELRTSYGHEMPKMRMY